MSQQSFEERLIFLESQVAQLQSERAQLRELAAVRAGQSEMRALFQAHQEYVSDRLDTFEEHITARLDVAEETNTARFAELQAGQQEHQAAIESLTGQVGQLTNQVGTLTGRMEELTGYVTDLAKGQQQIISLLSGRKSERHD